MVTQSNRTRASVSPETHGVGELAGQVESVGKKIFRRVCAQGAVVAMILCVLIVSSRKVEARPDSAAVASSQTISAGGATFKIDFAEGSLDLPNTAVVDRIRMAAHAVAVYYGRFPVSSVRILVVPVAGREGVLQGTTWGDMSGYPAFVRLRIGQSTTPEELKDDWMITHELVHTALDSLPDDQHWMEEGIASYVEPIARAQAGELPAERVWSEMVRGMPSGEPEAGDRGLDRTHTWGRTYWGGALFCLMADVEIRRETEDRRGLQDALSAIVAAGGTIDEDWPLQRVLTIGDRATGTRVLEQMYSQWSVAPVPVDLLGLWKQLGVRFIRGEVTFDSSAPFATIRRSIVTPSQK